MSSPNPPAFTAWFRRNSTRWSPFLLVLVLVLESWGNRDEDEDENEDENEDEEDRDRRLANPRPTRARLAGSSFMQPWPRSGVSA